MQVCERTHQGLVRASNQDSLIVSERLYGVADGMGGHNGGETASRITAQVLKNALSGKKPDEATLRMGIEAANRRVFDMAKHDQSLSGMGTTLTVLWEDENSILIAHVGDSRAYLMRNGELKQATLDHSLVAELLRSNVITADMARKHPYRNVITRAVGIDPIVMADVITEDKLEGDTWLICSDGLYNMVEDSKLAEILSSENIEEAGDRLIELSLEGGGTDNISFVLCRVAEVSAT